MPRPCLRFPSSLIAAFFAATPICAQVPVQFAVSGAPDVLTGDLRAASLMLSLGGTDTAQDVLSKAKAEYGVLLDTLYAAGHYGPVIHITLDGVEAADIAPLNIPATIAQVAVTIDAGPQFHFSRAAIAPVEGYTVLPKGFAVGAVAGSTVILDTATAVVSRWRDLGFAKARIADQSLVADHPSGTLAADMQVDQGPKLRFGTLTIAGTEGMDIPRVLAIAGLPTGQVFSPQEAERVATRLRRTGAFRSVALTEADQVTAPDQLDMTANLVEEKPRRYRFSGEIASKDGLSIDGQWINRNLFGGAERLTLSGSISKLGINTGGMDYDLGASFERPATFTPDTTLRLGTTFSRTKDGPSRNTALNVTGGLTQYFTNTLTGTASLAYHVSRVIDPSGTTEFQTLSLPFGLAWDTRAVKKDATDGVAITAELKPFYGLGAADNGLRLVWDARGYKSAGDTLVFAARVQAGAIFGASLAGTQRDDLFYSGGPATVRGQPYKSLGVYKLTTSGGATFQTGGTHFLAASVESRVKLGRNLGMVGFVDMGHVDAENPFSLAGNWHGGAGIGLRYLTTIGPIRLDIAGPISGNTGNGLQLYVGLGQAF